MLSSWSTSLKFMGFGLVAFLTVCSSSCLARPDFTVKDVVISDPNGNLTDNEYDNYGQRMTFQDKSGSLWSAPMSTTTGDWQPASGQNQLVDTNLASINVSHNGPEWSSARRGARIVYTKNIKGITQLAQAKQQLDLSWRAELLVNGENRKSPIGSKDRNDLNPRILYTYQDPLLGRTLAYRELDNPLSEGFITDSTASNGRWILGERSIILTITDQAGFDQVAKYNMDSQVLTQLTFDPTQKKSPWAWHESQLDNELVFFAVLDQQTIGVYRQNDQGEWVQVETIAPSATGYPFIISPEPFFYGGKSYISMQMSAADSTAVNANSTVWFSTVNYGQRPDKYRQVSASTPLVRQDPETFPGDTTIWEYYTERLKNGTHRIHRCDTGITLTGIQP